MIVTQRSNYRSIPMFPLLRAIFVFIGLAIWVQAVAQEPKVPFRLGGGWEGYRESCMNCHGEWGNGTDKGPPLMHQYYLPGHHGDDAFLRAILQGTKAHHWKFGDMPPVENIRRERAEQIIEFVRWLQKDQGLLH